MILTIYGRIATSSRSLDLTQRFKNRGPSIAFLVRPFCQVDLLWSPENWRKRAVEGIPIFHQDNMCSLFWSTLYGYNELKGVKREDGEDVPGQ